MTISTTTSRQSYNGNGVTTIFSVPFRFFANTDLVVELVTASTGASTTLTLTTHYTVTGADDEDGGSLTMLTAPAVGERLVIRRVIAATQEVDYVAGDPFPAETHERALDRLTMLAQQGEEVNARALVFPSGDTASGELPAVATRANNLLGFDSSGGLVVSAPASGSAAELALSLAGTGGAGLVGTLGGRNVQQTLDAFPTLSKRYATGDGTTDDTAGFQTFLNLGGSLYVEKGTYIVGPLNVVSNTKIVFHPEAVLLAKTGYTWGQRLLNISSTSVVIHGNGAVVQMRKADYAANVDVQNDQRHGVNIFGATDVTIYDLTVKDTGGDGFYVGAVVCRNINLINCKTDNCKRNGLSITNVINMMVLGGEYKNTTGWPPEVGIDVESNLLDNYYLQNVNILGVLTNNNKGGGVLITPQSKFAPNTITVRDCMSMSDGPDRGGLTLNAAMAYTPSTDVGLIGKIEGRVIVENFYVMNAKGPGVSSVNWTEHAPSTLLRNISVLNCASDKLVGAPHRERAGLLIRGSLSASGQHGSSIGNIEIDGISIRDTRTTKLMSVPVYFEPTDEADKPLKEIQIRGLETVPGEWTVATGTPPVLSSSALARTNVNIEHKKETVLTAGNFTVGLPHAGMLVKNTAGATRTLPAASSALGMVVEFEVAAAGQVDIALSSGTDSMAPVSTVAGKGIRSSVIGSRVKLRAEAGRWAIVSLTGTWTEIP